MSPLLGHNLGTLYPGAACTYAGTLDKGTLDPYPFRGYGGPNLGPQWSDQHRSPNWESSGIDRAMESTMAVILSNNSYIGSLGSPCSTLPTVLTTGDGSVAATLFTSLSWAVTSTVAYEHEKERGNLQAQHGNWWMFA